VPMAHLLDATPESLVVPELSMDDFGDAALPSARPSSIRQESRLRRWPPTPPAYACASIIRDGSGFVPARPGAARSRRLAGTDGRDACRSVTGSPSR
jgi:hypothetical protein